MRSSEPCCWTCCTKGTSRACSESSLQASHMRSCAPHAKLAHVRNRHTATRRSEPSGRPFTRARMYANARSQPEHDEMLRRLESALQFERAEASRAQARQDDALHSRGTPSFCAPETDARQPYHGLEGESFSRDEWTVCSIACGEKAESSLAHSCVR